MGGVFQPHAQRTETLILLNLAGSKGSAGKFNRLNERVDQLSREIRRRQQAEAERLRVHAQMMKAQKLESLGVLAGSIARDFITEAVKGAQRAAELTQQMLAYSGKGKFVVKP